MSNIIFFPYVWTIILNVQGISYFYTSLVQLIQIPYTINTSVLYIYENIKILYFTYMRTCKQGFQIYKKNRQK